MPSAPSLFASLVLPLAGVASAQAAHLVEVPLLPPPSGYSASPQVVHVSAAGSVVGTIYFTYKPCPRCPTQTVIRSFLAADGAATQLGPDGFVATSANEAGDVVGNLRNPVDGQTYPYLIRDGVFTPLSATPGTVLDVNELGQESYYPAINDQGFHAAMVSDAEHGVHALKFAGSPLADDIVCGAYSPDYECMTGYTTGFDAVHDLSNGPTVADSFGVGEDRDNPWSSSYGQQHAFVGYRGETTYLSSGFTAAALCVTDDGVIGGYDDGQAILWLPTGTGGWSEVTIASLVNDPSWTCREVSSVSESGFAAGRGTHDGVAAAFLFVPRRPLRGPGRAR